MSGSVQEQESFVAGGLEATASLLTVSVDMASEGAKAAASPCREAASSAEKERAMWARTSDCILASRAACDNRQIVLVPGA